MTLLHDPRAYLWFDITDDEEWATERFRVRFGADPEHVFDYERWLLVGPVPQEDER